MLNAINVVLVRHGETDDNVKRIVQGHSNSRLSDIGRKQAQLVGERLENEKFTKVYSSDLGRAFETAEILVNHCKFFSSEITSDRRLRERGFGTFEGAHISVLIEEAKKHGVTPKDLVPPGAETLADVRERVKDFVQTLFEHENGPEEENVLVVSHGAWLQCFMHYLHLHPQEFTLIDFDKAKGFAICGNTGISRIRIEPLLKSDEPRQIIFSSLFDVSHLKRDCDNSYLKTTAFDGI